MAIVTSLPQDQSNVYDFIVVGGGTAGCVTASRLSENLPDKQVLMVEAGPSDVGIEDVSVIKNWANLVGGNLDYNYKVAQQTTSDNKVPIVHSRGKVLGGSFPHAIGYLRPFDIDAKRWVEKGCEGWDSETLNRALEKVRTNVNPIQDQDKNELFKSFVNAATKALHVPVVPDLNDEIKRSGNIDQAVGFFPTAYNLETGVDHRHNVSDVYIHSVLDGDKKRSNLTVLTNAEVNKINISNGTVEGVTLKLQSGEERVVRSQAETILCAGAIDTPRLMLLSGLGPKQQLTELGIPVHQHIPGVGENLLDRPLAAAIFELNKPAPKNTISHADAGVFLRHSVRDTVPKDGNSAEVLIKCHQMPVESVKTGRMPASSNDTVTMAPQVLRPRSHGRLYLDSSDPSKQPVIDMQYLNDKEGYDIAALVHGIKEARKIAVETPLNSWVRHEILPGASVQTDADLETYVRNFVYTSNHMVGTTRMGNLATDELAVVDPKLNVRGIRGLRVCDAGVFPDLPSASPILTVLAVAERGAELIVADHQA